jgi:hypothetical protein
MKKYALLCAFIIVAFLVLAYGFNRELQDVKDQLDTTNAKAQMLESRLYNLQKSADNRDPASAVPAGSGIALEDQRITLDMHDRYLQMLLQVVNHLPGTTVRTAFVKGINVTDGTAHIVLDDVQMLHGDEAEKAAKEDQASVNPNGLYIRNIKPDNATLKLPKDLVFYELESAEYRRHVIDDYFSNPEGLADRLFYLRFVGDQLIFMEEVYRP